MTRPPRVLQSRAFARCRAFTLVEVVLAVSILSGMLVGVLSLYQRSASLRDELEREMDVVSGSRLLMNHMTRELECAIRHASRESCLVGTSQQLEFLTTAQSESGAGGLRLIRYGLDSDLETEESTGPDDLETVLLDMNTVGDDAGLGAVVEGERIVRRELHFTTAETDAIYEDESAVSLDREVPSMVISDRLRVLMFRYFDGVSWSSSWSQETLPVAVEIALAASASEYELAREGHRGLAFTRLVHIPAAISALESRGQSAEATGEDGDSTDEDSIYETDDGGEL